METFAFSKTMNNPPQLRNYFVSAACVLALALTAAVPAHAQSGTDHIPIALSDPSRPAHVKASLINGGISVKAYDGKQVIVDARTRNRENSRDEGGPKRLAISSTGLTIEEENNEVSINTESYARTIDLTISVPVHTSLKLRAINDGDIVVTGVEGEIDVTFPADLKANVSIRSDRGDVFSDFDVQLRAASNEPTVEDSRGKGGKYRVKIDKTVRGTINGGGPEIQFTNFQGQIYIRKAK